MRRNVLVIHPLLPRPDQCSGDHQLVQLIRLLRRADHAVTVVAHEQLPERADRERYARALTDIGCEVHELAPRGAAAAAWGGEVTWPALRAILDRNRFDAALVNFWNLALDFLPRLRQAAPDTRLVAHSWDVGYLREARGAALGGDLRRLRQIAPRRHAEICAYGLADAVLAVTDADRDVIAAGLRAEQAAGRLPEPWRDPPPVMTVTHTHAVAVDPPPFTARRDVLFVGYFIHPPNVDAALWLGREIWPLVARRLPGVRLRIVGAYAPREVQALAGRGIELLGFVPDLDPLLDGCRVAVAPLRYGAGLKGKVTQALAAGLPVVTTPCGAEGMPLESGCHALLGRDARELAAAVSRLYEDEVLWNRLSGSGRALVEARFGDTSVAAPFFQALFGALPPPAPAREQAADVAALDALLDGLEWEHYRRTPSLALARYTEAARLDPTLAAASLATASLELSLGDVPRATQALRRTRRLAPDLPRLPAIQAAALAAGGDASRAVTAAQRALAYDQRDPDALRVQGELLLAAGRTAQALTVLKQVQQICPGELATQRSLARATLAGGETAQAVALLGQGMLQATRTGQDRQESALREDLRQLLAAVGGPPIPHLAEPAEPSAAATSVAPTPRGDDDAPVASIVLLTHNALAYTRRCVEALGAHTSVPHELICVDNASDDGTVEFLRALAEEHPACRLVLNRENLGYAAGNNIGLALARGRDVVLLNSDVVVTPGWLERLIACARSRPRAGLVGPRTNHISGPQEVSATGYDQQTLEGLDAFAAAYARERAGGATPHWRAVGFCLLIRREVLARVGGLDPRFGRGNFEDDDYCLRALLAGYTTWFADDCFVHHFGGRSFVAAGIDLGESLRENWEIFKAKWELPPQTPYGEPVDMKSRLAREFDPARDHVPLPARTDAAPSAGAAERPPNCDDLLARGEARFSAGDFLAAARLFREALALAPDHTRARNDLACALWESGETSAALGELGCLLGQAPGDRDAAWNLGQFLAALGRREEAAQLYAACAARHPEAAEFAEALRAWEREGPAPSPLPAPDGARGGRLATAGALR